MNEITFHGLQVIFNDKLNTAGKSKEYDAVTQNNDIQKIFRKEQQAC